MGEAINLLLVNKRRQHHHSLVSYLNIIDHWLSVRSRLTGINSMKSLVYALCLCVCVRQG